MKPNVHLFKTCGQRYCYDVNKNVILRLNEEAFEAVCQWVYKNQKEAFLANPTLGKLVEEGYFKEAVIEEILHPLTNKLNDLISNSIHMLILQVTQNCNLRCRYCVYSGSYINRQHNNKRMTFDIAKKAIAFYMNHSSQTDKLRFGFYGGEPTLEMDLIKKCVELIKKNANGKEVEFHLTTNATVLTEEIMEFFVQNNFYLTISLDGSEEIQNKNRVYAFDGRGTFDTIIKNIEYIRKNYNHYLSKIHINVVMDPEDGYEKTNEFFSKDPRVQGISVTANEKNDVNYKNRIEKNEEYHISRSYENFKAVYHYYRNIQKDLSPLAMSYLVEFKKNVFDIIKLDETGLHTTHPGGPCVPGLQRLFANADGFLYPCERVNETADIMKIGHVDHGIDIDKVARLLNVGKITEEACKKCWAFRFCTSCAVYAEEGDRLSAAKRLERCEAIRNSAEGRLKELCVLKNMRLDFDTIEEEMVLV